MDPVRTQIWKFVVLFIGAVGCMIAPIAVGIVLEFTGPPPYLLRADLLGPEWAQPAPHAFPDGSTVTVTTYPDEAAARDGAGNALNDVPRESTEYTLSMTRYTRRDGGRRGLVLAVGDRVIHIEAADDRTVDARLADLPFLAENPEKGPSFAGCCSPGTLSLTLLGIAGSFLLWFALTMRAGSWAGSISPAPGVAPVQAEALRARLLAVNDLGLPFRVREEGRRLVAEWRIADARWVGLMEVGGLTSAHQICLELDPHRAHKVLARGPGSNRFLGRRGRSPGRILVVLSGESTSFSVRAALWPWSGCSSRTAGWTTTAYDYRFYLGRDEEPADPGEIVGSGWTFAPVVTFFRPLAWRC